jgi:hypothetical protein
LDRFRPRRTRHAYFREAQSSPSKTSPLSNADKRLGASFGLHPFFCLEAAVLQSTNPTQRRTRAGSGGFVGVEGGADLFDMGAVHADKLVEPCAVDAELVRPVGDVG